MEIVLRENIWALDTRVDGGITVKIANKLRMTLLMDGLEAVESIKQEVEILLHVLYADNKAAIIKHTNQTLEKLNKLQSGKVFRLKAPLEELVMLYS